MDESGNINLQNKTAGEAVVVVFFVFLILIFLVYKFGSNNQTVENTNPVTEENPQISKEDFEKSLTDTGGQNEIYFKYIKKIYDEQSINGKSANVDIIVSDYKNELEQSVAVPEQTVTLTNVSNTYSKTKYNSDYENAFAALQKARNPSEATIFTAQIADANTLIPLSNYDKETIQRIATEFELFAEKITNLNTPTIYKKRGEGVVKNSLAVAYILRQMVTVNDTKIYSLWISKYSAAMFDIIANRYAQ